MILMTITQCSVSCVGHWDFNSQDVDKRHNPSYPSKLCCAKLIQDFISLNILAYEMNCAC